MVLAMTKPQIYVQLRIGVFLIFSLTVLASQLSGCLGQTAQPTPFEMVAEGRLPAANAAINVTVNEQDAWDDFNSKLFNGTKPIDVNRYFVVVSVLDPGDATISVDRATIEGDVFKVYFKVRKGDPYSGHLPYVSIVKVDRRDIASPAVLVVHEPAGER